MSPTHKDLNWRGLISPTAFVFLSEMFDLWPDFTDEKKIPELLKSGDEC